MATATARHRYDRFGDRHDTPEMRAPSQDWTADDEPARTDPARCSKGRPLTGDGTCCLYHDNRPGLPRY